MLDAQAAPAGIPVLQGGEDVNEAHRGLAAAQSHALNARLVLLLANHVGSLAVLREALDAARAAARGEAAAATC